MFFFFLISTFFFFSFLVFFVFLFVIIFPFFQSSDCRQNRKNRREVPTAKMAIFLCDNSIFGPRAVVRNGPFEGDPAFMFFISPFFHFFRKICLFL